MGFPITSLINNKLEKATGSRFQSPAAAVCRITDKKRRLPTLVVNPTQDLAPKHAVYPLHSLWHLSC